MTAPIRVPSPAASEHRRRSRTYDVLVVGAGFAGAVIAERAASAGRRVLIIDRRDHIAGNAFDEADEHGILVHRYGPHLFHTNSEQVDRYLSRFTDWHPYEHRVQAMVDGQFIPVPINRDTINLLHGRNLRGGADVQMYLNGIAEHREPPRNSEDAVVNQVGRDLYERLFRGYTRKQWALEPSELDASVCARIPVRFDADDRYFTDRYQHLPADGYTAMFERILDHPRIERQLCVDFDVVRDLVSYRTLVWTGPIDEFYGCRLGLLPYRSLRFQSRSLETPDGRLSQPVGQINYPDLETPFTRSVEPRHFTGQRARTTTITYEFPTAAGDPYYPIPAPQNQHLYGRYAALAAATRDVVFVGSLASYRYLNMDQVVAQALKVAAKHFGSSASDGRTGEINPRASAAL